MRGLPRGRLGTSTLAFAVLVMVPVVVTGRADADPGAEPVVEADGPDPEVYFDGQQYWLFTTQSGFQSVPVRSATDVRSWSPSSDALPVLGSWAAWGWTWSPGVDRFGAGFTLYYTARDSATGVQCIGRAVASSPGGPYVDASPGPFVCQPELGGSIDADTFRDRNGTPWLVWKSDGNAAGLESYIWVARLAADGASLAGPPVPLVRSGAASDEGIIENPTMAPHGGHYLLVYSAGPWWTSRYHQDRATCDTPVGPCRREGEWLGSSSGLVGPGGGSLFQDAAGTWHAAVHSWRGAVGYEAGGRRSTWIGPVDLRQAPVWYRFPVAGQTSWYLREDAGPGQPDLAFPYGGSRALGLGCDWDGEDGASNGVFANGWWYLRNDANGGVAHTVIPYGAPGYRAACGDWDDEGGDTIGVFVNGWWHLRNSNDAGPPDVTVSYGAPGYQPVVGDWDGDGDDTIGVFVDGWWYLRNSNDAGPPDLTVSYGTAGYQPVVGDWDGDGDDTIGVFVDGWWHLRNSNSPGRPEVSFQYGAPGYRPVVGDWDGDQSTDVGVLVG